MKLSAFLVGMGVGCVLGSVAYTGYALANHALGADDDNALTPAECRLEANRAIQLGEAMVRTYHFQNVARRLSEINAYARQNGATER